MKRQLLNSILIFLFLPVYLFAQPSSKDVDLTGLWKGSLYNDTTKKYLPYEIAISEEKGKLSGYSYTLFDIDGKQELGVKKIKIKRTGDQLVIEDVELIMNDYSAPPPRKVRQLSVVNFLMNDTSMQLTGKWSTNQTREYLPLTGTLQLQRFINYRPLALFKKLEELKLDKGLSFVIAAIKQAEDIAMNEKAVTQTKLLNEVLPPPAIKKETSKEETAVITEQKTALPAKATPTDTVQKLQPIVAPPIIKPQEADEVPAIQKTNIVVDKSPVAKPVKSKGQTIAKIAANRLPIVSLQIKIEQTAGLTAKDSANIKGKQADMLAQNTSRDSKKINNQPPTEIPATTVPPPVIKKALPVAAVKEPAKKESQPVDAKSTAAVINQPKKVTTPVVSNTPLKPATVSVAANAETKPPALVISIAPVKKEATNQPPALPVSTAAANVSERKMNNQQGVFFESDSLVLTLYDNGDVDGDTVSVLMNGQIIFAKQGLSAKANTKTIYIEKGMPDTLSMVMYAENLGSIPPNTGLMIIMDGEKRHEVRFSADLKTNAAILLRRRIKEN
ncbi:MAG: hypothetical protein ABIN01_24740 [Ferruginibacter sp.]